MFNIGFAELVVVLLIAFLVVGPSDLPKVAIAAAKMYKKARRLWEDLLGAINLEEELKNVEKAKSEVQTAIQNANPLEQVKKEFEGIQITNPLEQVKKEVEGMTKTLGAVQKEAEEKLKK